MGWLHIRTLTPLYFELEERSHEKIVARTQDMNMSLTNGSRTEENKLSNCPYRETGEMLVSLQIIFAE